MNLDVTRRELLADREKFDSFVKEIVDRLLISLEGLDETHPVWQFGRLFRDCEVTVTVELKDWGRSDFEPGSGHPTLRA